ncbi:MAG: IclR family transcriptional regulator, partial [Parvibaculaceae bacterium]
MGTGPLAPMEGTAPALLTAPSATAEAQNSLYVTSIEKGIRVMNAFMGERALGLAEVARKTGLDMSAVQRFVYTWQALGYLQKDERTRRYHCSPKMLDWALIYQYSDPLIVIAAPALLAMVEETGQATNLGRLVGAEVIYVSRIPSRRARLVGPVVGDRAPAFCTASGRAIMSRLDPAEVDEILAAAPRQQLTRHTIVDRGAILERIALTRSDGFTIAVEECLLGEITVASPITGNLGRPVASVNLSMKTSNFTLDRVRAEMAPAVVNSATVISE